MMKCEINNFPGDTGKRERRSSLKSLTAALCSVGLALLFLSTFSMAFQSHGHFQQFSGNSGFVFTATNSDTGNAVIAFRRLPNGALSPFDQFPTGGLGTGSGLGNQGGLLLSGDGQWLFVVNAGSDSVSVFSVNPNGLNLVDTEASGGTRPISLALHGDLLYVLNAGGDGNIAGFLVGPNGDLAPLGGSTRALSGSGVGPAQISFSSDGKVLIVTEKAANAIATYTVDGDGLPGTAVAHTSAGTTPFGFAVDRHDRIFVSEAAGGAPGQSTISSYQVLPNGDVEVISPAVATGQSAACWILLTRNERFGYATNTGSGNLTGFGIDGSSGEISLLDASGSTAGAGAAPIDMARSRNGRFVYALNAGDDSISIFKVQADGSLSPLDTVTGLPPSTNGLAAQ